MKRPATPPEPANEFNLNHVIEQVANVCQTTVVRDAWDRGQPLAVHGWVYGLQDGLIRDLRASASSADEGLAAYRYALASL
jgi:carbonic anhydrase